MKIVASYSIKGGVGKTAASVNLAYAAAKSGNETLLIDLDPQGASSFYFCIGASKKEKRSYFFTKKNRLLSQIKGSNYKRLDILPANLSFRNFDIMLNKMSKSKQRLKELLSSLKNEYDLIILDCPPNINLLSENIFNAADMILVPVIPTTLSERTYEQLLTFFAKNGYKKKIIRPFFSMAQGNNKLHHNTINDMEKRHPEFMKSIIGFSAEIERMGIHREPVLAYASKKSNVQAYRTLFNEIARIMAKKK
ncbi:MAG: AAA family ATPase [gamma proteobacterium symbiont of Lucinoma myriamae]|nr:AAA family ATPase [gamma proteobacterium symbiont of Lucinoma myriamae]MCU7817592.1 AAA family ATPase [gamma proteobacterium symbiont of Lucinoma myriamae]